MSPNFTSDNLCPTVGPSTDPATWELLLTRFYDRLFFCSRRCWWRTDNVCFPVTDLISVGWFLRTWTKVGNVFVVIDAGIALQIMRANKHAPDTRLHRSPIVSAAMASFTKQWLKMSRSHHSRWHSCERKHLVRKFRFLSQLIDICSTPFFNKVKLISESLLEAHLNMLYKIQSNNFIW